jgi:hypothetical protein
VLKAEDNEILTRVGPGTLMGELLRRYWTPACLSAQRDRPAPLHGGERLPASQEVREKRGIFSGVDDFVSQDFMVTESMGPVYDRSQEQLGSTDKAITRMRHILLSAAKGLAEGKEPPALAGNFTVIRGAEKILEPGEDWRALGTEDDPVVRESSTATTGVQLTDMVD